MKHVGPAVGLIERRAILRPYALSDADALMQALKDPELLHWLAALPIPLDREARKIYLQFLDDPDVRASVICIDDRPVGLVSLGTELSFWLTTEYHGQGVGLWAVRQFLDQAPASPDVVTACCMRENQSAIATLVRLGFECTNIPFRRFSYAHGRAVDFLRYQLCRPKQVIPCGD